MAKTQKVVNGELVETDDPIVDDPIVDDPIVDDPIVDEDGNPIEKVIEPWLVEDSKDVPVATHVHMKQKLKGRISEKDSRIETLEAENEALKASENKVVDLPKRPKKEEFDSDELYQSAVDDYDDKRDYARYTRLEQTRDIKDRQLRAKQDLDKAVDSHYERAGVLITESGIDEKVYQQADEVVRSSVEAIKPKQGDLIVDQLISLLGEGSEKVMYFIGRNRTALTEVKSLLAEDPSGMKAAIYLGQQKERLLNPKKPTSSAPPPSKNPKGDALVNESKKVTNLKKKYTKAHKDGDLQAAFDIKREARLLGSDTSKWHEET